MTISVIILDTRTCIILFYFRYSHITTDDNVPVLQFIVDIFEILKYSITDRGYLLLFFFFFFQCEIEFYFTEWTPKAVFSRVAVATSENTGFGVHE